MASILLVLFSAAMCSAAGLAAVDTVQSFAPGKWDSASVIAILNLVMAILEIVARIIPTAKTISPLRMLLVVLDAVVEDRALKPFAGKGSNKTKWSFKGATEIHGSPNSNNQPLK